MARYSKALTPDQVKQILDENNAYQTMLDRIIDLINGYMRMPEWNSLTNKPNHIIRIVNNERINVWFKIVLWEDLGEKYSEKLFNDLKSEYNNAGWIVTFEKKDFDIPYKKVDTFWKKEYSVSKLYPYYELVFKKKS